MCLEFCHYNVVAPVLFTGGLECVHFQGGKLKYELDGLRWKSSICDDGTGEGPPTGEGERLTPEGGVTINALDKGEGVMRPVRALACAVDEH
jgi:hypothetical protein